LPKPRKPHGDPKAWVIELLNAHPEFSKLCDDLKQLEVCGRAFARPDGKGYKTSLQEVKRQSDALLAGINFEEISVEFGNCLRQEAPRKYMAFEELEASIKRTLQSYVSLPELRFDILLRKWVGSEASHGKKSAAVRYLMNLTLEGKLNRVRRCVRSECNRWFIARVKKQQCCSTGCRKVAESKDLAFKKGRARYMRDYRSREKARHATRQATQTIGRFRHTYN
jgi:hypothetical protein